jgi:hypothetical protein
MQVSSPDLGWTRSKNFGAAVTVAPTLGKQRWNEFRAVAPGFSRLLHEEDSEDVAFLLQMMRTVLFWQATWNALVRECGPSPSIIKAQNYFRYGCISA